jgi:hypothetical protein
MGALPRPVGEVSQIRNDGGARLAAFMATVGARFSKIKPGMGRRVGGEASYTRNSPPMSRDGQNRASGG